MKLLQTFVVAVLLTGAVAHAGVDNPAASRLEPGVQRLKEQLSLTEHQTQELDKIFKEHRAEREAVITEIRNSTKKSKERMNAVLTQEQRKIYEEKRWEDVPEHPGKPER
jgi:Spy/CpxP family protein refolding chaperone